MNRVAIARVVTAGLGVWLAAGIESPGCQDKTRTSASPAPTAPNRADEPKAKEFSLRRALAFMDAAAARWNAKQRCVTCHTNGLYLVARAGAPERESYRATRKLARGYLKRYVVDGAKPSGRRGAIEALVATTSLLTLSDMATIGRLDPVTRRGLDHILANQSEGGAWSGWLKCGWPPFESDDHFGATLAALALGAAPAKYRRGATARKGLAQLLGYLKNHPPQNAHHQGMLLWAATALPEIATAATRKRWLENLSRLQRKDGGWRLVDLGAGKWKRPKEPAAGLPSDAYATGFAVFVLRRGGIAARDPRLRRGLAWLRADQRESGRWFVRSPKRDGKHYISHAATQFAVMAFAACGERAKPLGSGRRQR